MKLNLSLDIELDDMVTLAGRKPMKVVEVCKDGLIVLWDADRSLEIIVDLYLLVRGAILVERTETHVFTP